MAISIKPSTCVLGSSVDDGKPLSGRWRWPISIAHGEVTAFGSRDVVWLSVTEYYWNSPTSTYQFQRLYTCCGVMVEDLQEQPVPVTTCTNGLERDDRRTLNGDTVLVAATLRKLVE